jgi:hypothetical protein
MYLGASLHQIHAKCRQVINAGWFEVERLLYFCEE